MCIRDRLKQLLSFYQVATRIGDVYDVAMPPDVKALLNIFELININVGSIGLPLQCLGLGTYEQQLATTMMMPVIIAAVLLVFHLVSSCVCGETGGPGKRLSAGLLAALPGLLRLSFLVFPMVSSAAFRAFSCEAFDNGRSYLRADYSVECTTLTYESAMHENAKNMAWLGILLYPVGISALYIALMLRARRSILDGKQTALSKALDFLVRDFEPAYLWWDVLEAWKKLFFVGFAVLLSLIHISEPTRPY